MRIDSDQRSAATARREAEHGPGPGGCAPPQLRLEQAVGHELAQRLLAALSGPHGRYVANKT